jgi:hypothetical protein
MNRLSSACFIASLCAATSLHAVVVPAEMQTQPTPAPLGMFYSYILLAFIGGLVLGAWVQHRSK